MNAAHEWMTNEKWEIDWLAEQTFSSELLDEFFDDRIQIQLNKK